MRDIPQSSPQQARSFTLRAVNLRRIDKGSVLGSFDLWLPGERAPEAVGELVARRTPK